MRIIAKKKDYYDCIQSYAQDRSVLYVRNEEKVVKKLSEFSAFPPFFGVTWSGIREGHPRIIGFCGKLYPLVELYVHNYCSTATHCPRPSDSPDKVVCYSMADVDAFANEYFGKEQLARYQGTLQIRKHAYAYRAWANGYNRATYVKWFDDVNKVSGKFGYLFDEKRSPVFTMDYNTYQREINIVYNAMLNQYQFFRVFNPHEAYQNIFMFLSNMAVPQKAMPVISNDDKITTHGFDLKHSFRNTK